MAQFETWFDTDLTCVPQTRVIRGNVFTQDSMGNLIGVRVTKGGEAVALSGEVIGYVIRADGSTVVIENGVIEANTAFITLPESCYAVPGQIQIVIRLVSGAMKTVLLAATAHVQRSATGLLVDPGAEVPDITALLAKIGEMEAATSRANAAAAAALLAIEGISASGGTSASDIPAFDAADDYAVGDVVSWDGAWYRCVQAWNSSDFHIIAEEGNPNADYWEPMTPAVIGGGLDATLTVAGMAADAKATGDRLTAAEGRITQLLGYVSALMNGGGQQSQETVACAGVSLNADVMNFGVGSVQLLTAALTPANTTDIALWTSSDPAVVTVFDGRVTAVGVGTATITVTCGSYSDTCAVTVHGNSSASGSGQGSGAISCQGLYMSASGSVTLTVPNPVQVIVNPSPADTTDALTLANSDDTVLTASISLASGGAYYKLLMQPLSNGTATVTVTCGRCSASLTVTVNLPETGACTDISLNAAALTLNAGSSYTLTADKTPANTSDPVTWASSDTAVATVSEGVVTAVGIGTATITVTCGSCSASCQVQVTGTSSTSGEGQGSALIPCTGVTLDYSELPSSEYDIHVGDVYSFTAALTPANTTDTLVWESSNTDVATVSDGIVTIVGKGRVSINATCGEAGQGIMFIVRGNAVAHYGTSTFGSAVFS